MKQRLPVFAAALWWGSLTVIGFLVVPLLFAHLPTPAMAGSLAAKLFTAQTWVSLGCGLLLLMATRMAPPAGQADHAKDGLADWAQPALVFIMGSLLLALLSEFAVAPRIVARENLKLWHSVGSAMYLLQWLGSGVVLWKLAKR